MLYYIIYFEKLFDKFKYYVFKCFLKIDLQSKFYDNSIIRRGNNMIDNKEKTYPEQKSLPRGESSLSPQDSDRSSHNSGCHGKLYVRQKNSACSILL